MKNEIHYSRILERLYNRVEQIEITDTDKFVIFSDFHLGNRGRKDDFLHNSELFIKVLREHYLEKGYKLILNGDIEDLYRFDINTIAKSWSDLFEIFNEFNRKGNLYKIVGNHDYLLYKQRKPEINRKILQGLKLKYKDNDIFIYHGHQISNFIETFNLLSLYLIKYIVTPLGIHNNTVSINSIKKFKTEIRAYNFSAEKKIISIIGHTHRPLFESMSKIDALNMLIEKYLRLLHKTAEENKEFITHKISQLRTEFDNLRQNGENYFLKSGIYGDELLVPCLFNSGAGIGKRGMTALEIKKGKIHLVYWFDSNKSKRYLNYDNVKSKQFKDTQYFKAILKKESLDYIFSRIKLLA
ncbi:MAG: metallophosphoesterase family protein [Candidatus Kapabacteria bacterium]|nr:metallophosphoesterase family protein [Candidatus Kapabacteria bacterium]